QHLTAVPAPAGDVVAIHHPPDVGVRVVRTDPVPAAGQLDQRLLQEVLGRVRVTGDQHRRAEQRGLARHDIRDIALTCSRHGHLLLRERSPGPIWLAPADDILVRGGPPDTLTPDNPDKEVGRQCRQWSWWEPSGATRARARRPTSSAAASTTSSSSTAATTPVTPW